MWDKATRNTSWRSHLFSQGKLEWVGILRGVLKERKDILAEKISSF